MNFALKQKEKIAGASIMPRKFSVLIPDGTDYGTLKVLRCLGQASEMTTHILSQIHRPIIRFSRYCTKCHYHASQTDTEWIDAIKDVVKKYKIDVLLPITMPGVEFASRNYNTLKEIAALPPIPEFERLKMAQDKWSLHCFVKEQGLPVVPTVFVADGKRIVADPAELDTIVYPALLKPTTERGGRGIVKIDNPSDFYRVMEQKMKLKDGQRYILQNYIPGIDLCLGVFCKAGRILAYTLQKDLLLSNDSFDHQKAMEFVHDNRILEIGKRLISAMAWDGIAFIDFRADSRDDKIWLIEVNPRLGRAFLGALAAGVNYPLNSCLSAMGISIFDSQRDNVRYVHPSAFFSMLKSRIIGRPTPAGLRWWESGLRYTVSDPLPEFIKVIHYIRRIKWFQPLYNRRRNKGDQ